jgi:hypothetical protein
MRAVMPPESIHLFDNLYPSTSGLSVKWIDEIRVYRGGYTGLKGDTVKSLSEGSESTAAPTAGMTLQGIPLPSLLAPLAAAAAGFLSWRRSR